MKKKLAALIATGAILLSAATVFAGKPADTPNNGKSHEKATGNVELSAEGRYLEFNAHETNPAKGEIHWWRIYEDESQNDFYANVNIVSVVGNYATIEGTVYESTFGNINPGFTFTLEVTDNSTPGYDESNPDKVIWQWVTGLTARGEYTVVDGNLVVHGLLCDVYDLDINSVNGNSNYTHEFEITFCPNEDPFGEGYGDQAGTQTISLIEFNDLENELSFRSDYDSNSYYWFPSFMLEEGGSLNFQEGYGMDNVYDATGTWSMYTE